jgi:hypothetical protein
MFDHPMMYGLIVFEKFKKDEFLLIFNGVLEKFDKEEVELVAVIARRI